MSRTTLSPSAEHMPAPNQAPKRNQNPQPQPPPPSKPQHNFDKVKKKKANIKERKQAKIDKAPAQEAPAQLTPDYDSDVSSGSSSSLSSVLSQSSVNVAQSTRSGGTGATSVDKDGEIIKRLKLEKSKLVQYQQQLEALCISQQHTIEELEAQTKAAWRKKELFHGRLKELSSKYTSLEKKAAQNNKIVDEQRERSSRASKRREST